MRVESAVAAPLLATKTHVPPLRASLLPRPRLTRQLEEGLRLGCKLTLVSAPAGYGKTSMLGDGPSGGDPQRTWALGLIHVGMAEVLYECNELEAAERHAEEGLGLGEPRGYMEILKKGYLALVWVKHARGDARGALDATLRLERIMRPAIAPGSIASVASQRARLALAQGALEAAERWAEQVPAEGLSASADVREYHALTLARLLIARGRAHPGGPHLAQAAQSLQRLLADAEGGGRMGRAIEILLLQALALDAQGQRRRALAAMERAVTLAEPEGYVRTLCKAPRQSALRQASNHPFG